MKPCTVLIVLDGWGIGKKDESNPIHMANLETVPWLEANFPVTSLQASGIAVGLPWGEVGNSEVGHLTLGAGKILYQYYPKITLAIRDGSFYKNQAFLDAFAHAKKNNSAVHLVGLLSNANVHASIEHLQALLRLAAQENISRVVLDLFADGKDGEPRALPDLLKQLPREKIGLLIGRYYAMDRNQNWQLTKTAYDALTGPAAAAAGPEAALQALYAKGLSEEYLPAMRLNAGTEIKDGDALIFFNFREDSIRELAEAFLAPDFAAFAKRDFKNVYAATMTRYESRFTAPFAFPPDEVQNPFGKVVADSGRVQLRLAETYKYAHVTYFFNGFRENPFPQEYRVLIPSLNTFPPEGHPEMRASAVTDRLLEALAERNFDFILVNYANPDTMAHTANYAAAIAAAKTIDGELARILQAAHNPETTLVITSDHGHLERLLDPKTGLPQSQHAPSPVPFYVVGEKWRGRKFANAERRDLETSGTLADVAPTLIELMGLIKPPEMSGRSLLDGII